MVKNKYYDAMKSFLINSQYNITDEILKYILTRIRANKIEIKKLISINKEKITYEDIANAIKEEIDNNVNCKDYKNLYINKHFLSVQTLMPIGVIAVEVFETTEIIRYFIRAIKSRNAIVISDIEYNELSVKYLIYGIIKEALKKFNIDGNLIDILPFDECYYNNYDRVIYTYDEYGEKLEKTKYNILEYNNKNYIYLADNKFKDILIKDNSNFEYELIEGKFYDVINKLNESRINSAIIYTSNPEEAFKFINLITAKNVFVNASLENIKEYEKSDNELYEYKNIIIPIPDNDENKNENSKSNNALIELKGGIFEKIKTLLHKFFYKR